VKYLRTSRQDLKSLPDIFSGKYRQPLLLS
jgi:hypothetical protein